MMVFLIVVVLLSLPAWQVTSFAQGLAPVLIQHELVKKGDVVHQGTRTAAGTCAYPAFVVAVPATRGIGRILDLRNDELCHLVVADKQEVPIEQIPSGIRGTPETRRRAALPRLLDRLAPQPAKWSSPSSPRLRNILFLGPTNIEQTVRMYGYGGQSDVLTQKRGWLSFEWFGPDNAQMRNEDGDCYAAGFTGWANTSCRAGDTQWGPASAVYRGGEGDFYWTPGPGYNHALWDSEYGYSNGDTGCYYGYTGSIVAGVYNICRVY
jgi:hypothetical protein